MSLPQLQPTDLNLNAHDNSELWQYSTLSPPVIFYLFNFFFCVYTAGTPWAVRY